MIFGAPSLFTKAAIQRASLAALVLCASGAGYGCSSEPDTSSSEGSQAATENGGATGREEPTPGRDPAPPARDGAATARIVMDNLLALRAPPMAQSRSGRRLLFGQQEADVSTTWTNGLTPVTGDVEKLVGRAPAVISYELANAYPESPTAFDVEGLRKGLPALRDIIRYNYRRGTLVSLVWHPRCPKTQPSASDKYAPADCPQDYNLAELLPNKPAAGPDGRAGVRGKHYDEWVALQNELVEFFWSLKDDDGAPIPVLFRPFHEFTGDWFWWGRTNTPEVYKQVWTEMVSFMRNKRGLRSLIWVFCPDKPTDAGQVRNGGDFERYYPGDDYVDVIGFDRYDFNDGQFAAGFQADLAKVGKFAREHGKIAAVTEVGNDFKRFGVNANPKWFTKNVLAPLLGTQDADTFSYVSVWRNAPWEKYMPEPQDGELTTDFRAMASEGTVVFAGDVGNLYKPLNRPTP